MPIEITKKQIAEFLECTERSVTDYQNRQEDPLPVLQRGKRGTANVYDAIAVHKWDLRRKLGDTKRIDLDKERARLTKAQADAQEMKNEVMRQEVAPVKLLEFAIARFSESIGSILDSVPLKVKKRLPHLKAVEVELITREIVKCKNAAARIQIDWDQVEDIN